MSRKEDTTQPTIAQVLEEFLEDQRSRLAPRTYRRYEDVVRSLEHCIDGYGHLRLEPDEAKFHDKRMQQEEDPPPFTRVHGPRYILESYGEFLDYFLVRKVIAGKDFLRAAGTVTKKLARWLAEKGYAEGEAAEEAREHAAEAGRDLPRAEELLDLLMDHTDKGPPPREDDVVEGYFTVTRTEGARLWFEDDEGEAVGPVSLPRDLARRFRVGWTLSGAMERRGGKWRLAEAWSIYPS